MKYRLFFNKLEFKVIKNYFLKNIPPTSTWKIEDHSCVISCNNDQLYEKMTLIISETLEVACSVFKDCDECNGSGTYEKMECHNQSNECCGGCIKEYTCEDCDDGDALHEEFYSNNYAV